MPLSEPINLITAVGDILKHVERFILKDSGHIMAIDALKVGWIWTVTVVGHIIAPYVSRNQECPNGKKNIIKHNYKLLE